VEPRHAPADAPAHGRSDRVPRPRRLPHGGGGQHFKLRQVVVKPLRDTKLAAVEARRYGCMRCGRTFRVYPGGVSPAQTAARLRGLGVLLYLLGRSYGAVAPFVK
jgi:hypothetical protein